MLELWKTKVEEELTRVELESAEALALDRRGVG